MLRLAFALGAIQGAMAAQATAQLRANKLANMSDEERERFYREEQAQFERRRVEAAEQAAAALEKRARRLFL